MKKTVTSIALLGLLCLIAINRSYGQASATDSAQYHAAITTFYKALGPQSPLYTGFEPKVYSAKVKGSVFYNDTLQLIKGSVNYNGIVYQNVPLVYDVYQDVVMSVLPDQVTYYDLVALQVIYFNMGGHHFVRLTSDTTNLKTGFYDELYNKKLRVLVRTEKEVQTTSNNQHLENYYDKSTNYYLKKGNTYYSINSEGALISILKDKKKELKQYISDNKMKYKKDPGTSARLLAAYYDSLTN